MDTLVLVRYVLFACTHNAGRSPMAQAFFQRHGPADVCAESAGQQPRREGVWPNVVEAMKEVDVDLAGRKPTRLTPEMQLHADWAVTLACGATCPFVPGVVEDWDVPDPAGLTLAETRVIRDDVEQRVIDLVEHRIELIRSDRTAHELRLQALLPELVDEFVGQRSDAEIRSCADAVLATFADAPIRSHVMTLARRRTVDCLRSERCDALAPGGR